MRGVRRTGWGGGIGAGGPLIVALLFAIPEGVRSQGLTIQLSPSDHNGYAISCFGGRDGHIDLTVSGGSPPYTYEWSTGASTQDVSDLAAGYYRVAVYDSDTGSVEGEITLNEPEQLIGTATAFEYPNEYNVSCHSCYNGSIDAGAEGGVAPYTYEWKDGPTVEDRSGLGTRDYSVVVRDANGCEAEQVTLILREPQRNDWTMSGNAGTIPGPHYIGTSDNMDVVFKSNGIERFRLRANGEVQIAGLGDGLLRSSGGIVSVDPMDPTGGATLTGIAQPFWSTHGNWLTPDPAQFLGTLDAHDLTIRTNNTQRMVVTTNGNVGIGTGMINGVPGLLTLRSGPGDWLVFQNADNGQDLGAWSFTNTPAKDRLRLQYVPSGGSAYSNITFWNNGKVSIGDDVNIVTPDHEYGLYVWKGILTEKVKVALRSSSEWSDHVFLPGYRLLSLREVKLHIDEHGHLPGVPSSACMVEHGLDVVRTDAMLLEKIEELTLHLIDLSERLERVEQENERMRATIGLVR